MLGKKWFFFRLFICVANFCFFFLQGALVAAPSDCRASIYRAHTNIVIRVSEYYLKKSGAVPLNVAQRKALYEMFLVVDKKYKDVCRGDELLACNIDSEKEAIITEACGYVDTLCALPHGSLSIWDTATLTIERLLGDARVDHIVRNARQVLAFQIALIMVKVGFASTQSFYVLLPQEKPWWKCACCSGQESLVKLFLPTFSSKCF